VRRRLLKTGIRLLGPALLVLVVLRIDNRAALLDTLARVEALPLLLALALNAVSVHCKVLRWRILLGTRGYRYSLGRAWKAFMATLYLGMLTPGRVGDVLRVQYMRHDLKVPYAEGLAVIAMDRFCDIYVLLGFVAVGIAHFATILTGQIATVTWLGVAVTALAPLLLFVPGLAERLMGRVYARLARERHAGGLERFLAALRAQVGRGLLLTIPITAAAFMTNYLQGWLMGQSLGLALSFFDVMCMLAITSLLSLLPISVAGVGVRELFLALAFPAIGLLAAEGVAFGILVFTVIYLALVLGGFVAWQLAPPPIAEKKDG